MFATVRDVYADRPEGATIYGLFSAMLAFVPALGPMLGAAIAAGFGWRAIFVALGAAALLAWLRAMPRWRETRPSAPGAAASFAPMLGNLRFWIYTLGFSAAMGAFFVFFSTSPRVLMGAAGYSHGLQRGLLDGRAGHRGHAAGAAPGGALGHRRQLRARGGDDAGGRARRLRRHDGVAATFVMPMWLVAAGMVLVVSVSANGALRTTATRRAPRWRCYAAQSLIVAGLARCPRADGDSAWPLVAYAPPCPRPACWDWPAAQEAARRD